MKTPESPGSDDGKPAPEPTEPSYHHGNLRAALIEAGLAALESNRGGAQAGQALSLRELARQVGVTPNAAYRHFANKEALLKALAAEGFRQLAAQSQAAHQTAAASGAGQQEGFRASGLAYVRFARANPSLFRLMFGRFASDQRDADLTQAAMGAFQGVLTSASQLGGLPEDDPRTLVSAIIAWSLVHGLGHLALDGQLDHFSPDVDQLIETVMGHVDPRFQERPQGT
ncbi:MAG: TetR/AcrR family transcriptional regulator [Rubrivivax sp.]|nr:MAG: TetR/AcrR family transcriptional regulator [Rubrivivax sp.]